MATTDLPVGEKKLHGFIVSHTRDPLDDHDRTVYLA